MKIERKSSETYDLFAMHSMYLVAIGKCCQAFYYKFDNQIQV